MSALAVAPILIPLTTAAATTLARRHPRLQRAISDAGGAGLLAVAVALVVAAARGTPARVAVGGWPAPFGIELHVDATSAVLVAVAALLGVSTLVFLRSDADTASSSPLRLPLLHGVLLGVCGAFCTADLFNLYVWFEVMLICALGLLAGDARSDQLDATVKYLVLNLFGTLLLLLGIAHAYAVTGQLHFDALRIAFAELSPAMRATIAGPLVVAFLIKAAAFPFFVWLPASYHTLPAPVLALFAGLLTKVGVYAVLRVLAAVFVPAPPHLNDVLGWLACITMLVGVLGAAYHYDVRRILAFHVVSQIGYILLGIALGTQAGAAAATFYTVHHIIVKANLFFIAAIICRVGGSYDLRRVGGLLGTRPALALLFLVPALSLVGAPPLSGFWAKLLILQEAIAQGRAAWTAIALFVSVLTLYSMMKIWLEAFWKPAPEDSAPTTAASTTTTTRLAPAWVVTVSLALITIAIGLMPQMLWQYTRAAAAAMGAP